MENAQRSFELVVFEIKNVASNSSDAPILAIARACGRLRALTLQCMGPVQELMKISRRSCPSLIPCFKKNRKTMEDWNATSEVTIQHHFSSNLRTPLSVHQDAGPYAPSSLQVLQTLIHVQKIGTQVLLTSVKRFLSSHDHGHSVIIIETGRLGTRALELRLEMEFLHFCTHISECGQFFLVATKSTTGDSHIIMQHFTEGQIDSIYITHKEGCLVGCGLDSRDYLFFVVSLGSLRIISRQWAPRGLELSLGNVHGSSVDFVSVNAKGNSAIVSCRSMTKDNEMSVFLWRRGETVLKRLEPPQLLNGLFLVPICTCFDVNNSPIVAWAFSMGDGNEDGFCTEGFPELVVRTVCYSAEGVENRQTEEAYFMLNFEQSKVVALGCSPDNASWQGQQSPPWTKDDTHILRSHLDKSPAGMTTLNISIWLAGCCVESLMAVWMLNVDEMCLPYQPLLQSSSNRFSRPRVTSLFEPRHCLLTLGVYGAMFHFFTMNSTENDCTSIELSVVECPPLFAAGVKTY